MEISEYPITGVDVSHHQPPPRMRYERVGDFLVARATYGVRPDKHFLAHMDGARAAGKLVTGYHFFRQTQPADEQLDAFTEHIGRAGVGAGDILPVLDLESNAAYDGKIDPELFSAGARSMAVKLRASYGDCLIYGGGWFYQLLRGHGDWILDYPAWAAHYRGSKSHLGPSMPPGKHWRIWQHTGHGRTAAYDGDLDLNVARELPPLIAPAPVRMAKALAKWLTPKRGRVPIGESPPSDYEVAHDSPRAE